MPIAAPFKALSYIPGGLGAAQVSPGYWMDVYMPLADALNMWWNVYKITVDVSYTHQITHAGVNFPVPQSLTFSKTQTTIVLPGKAPVDRVVGNLDIDVPVSVDEADYTFTSNGTEYAATVEASFSSLGSYWRLNDGSPINDILARWYCLASYNDDFGSGAGPRPRGQLLSVAQAAYLLANGDHVYPASNFHKAGDVSLNIFGVIVPAVFIGWSSFNDPPLINSISGWNFTVTREDYTYA